MSMSHDFAEAMNDKFVSDASNFIESFSVEEGRKYDRIVVNYNSHRCVFAFVERATGNLLKAATWKVPAKDARYFAEDVMTKAVHDADTSGRFLYKN